MSTWTRGARGLVVGRRPACEDRVEALIQGGKDVVEKHVQLDMDGQK